MTDESHDRGSGHPYRSARSAIWSLEIPARNSHFTGRREELETLRSRLADSSIGVLSQPPQAVYGLGGIGKPKSPWNMRTAMPKIMTSFGGYAPSTPTGCVIHL